MDGTLQVASGASTNSGLATEKNKKIAKVSPGYKSTATEKADVPDNAYPDGQVTDQALAALQTLRESDAPFVLGAGYYKPHLPFTAPAKYWDLYEAKTIPLTEHDKSTTQRIIMNSMRINYI